MRKNEGERPVLVRLSRLLQGNRRIYSNEAHVRTNLLYKQYSVIQGIRL
jgi:hypothetical protein